LDSNLMIETIISRHENRDSTAIQVCENLHLEPMLGYSGKMARKAYQGYRKKWHEGRKYVGLLDFRIMDPTGKMEHSKLLARSIGRVPIEALREIYDGADPTSLGLSKPQLALASDIQCSFAEQEINWGIREFQLRTHFGYPEMKAEHLRNAVPRDFFMMYFERCTAEILGGSSIESALRRVSDPQYQESFVASKMVLMPPIVGSGNSRRIMPDFLPFLRSSCLGGAEPWIDLHLDRISDLCDKSGISPYWQRAFG
jgi:hypothetical protein